MKKQKSFTALLGLLIIIASLSLVGVVNAQAGAGLNQITIRDQNTDTGQVIVESVTAAETGWLVLYKNPNCCPLSIVGYAPVREGENANFTVDVDGERVDSSHTLWAVLHTDQGIVGTFEWGVDDDIPNNDAPVEQGGQRVMTAFGTSAQ